MTNNIALEIVSIAGSFSTRNGYNMILKEIGGKRKLQIIIGTVEAQSIVVAMQKIMTSRPMTHEFMQSVLTQFDIQLKFVKIYKYEEGVFYSYAIFEDASGTVHEFDCRTSDAIALALRYDRPILTNEQLFQDSHHTIESSKHSSQDMEHDLNEPEDSLELSKMDIPSLQVELKKAVDQEDFERASMIQAELNKRVL